MTLTRTTNGYTGDFRAKGIKRLHLSMKTSKPRVAQQRHDAVHLLFVQRRVEMIEQLRTRVLTVERVAEMVAQRESLTPLPAPLATADAGTSWGTVSECCARYVADLKAHRRRAPRTAVAAKTELRKFEAFVVDGRAVGTMPLEDVRPEMIRAYEQSLIDKPMSPNTITNYVARVGALWNWLRRTEGKAALRDRRAPLPVWNPVDREESYVTRVPRERMLTREEIARVLAETPQPLLFPLCAMLMAGLRLGEMQHLRPGIDVDLEMGTLTIREQPTWRPKTERSKRTVPMPERLRALADVHAQVYASASWMLPSPFDPAQPMSQDTWTNHLHRIVTRAKLTPGRKTADGVTSHAMRHTFISHAIMSGVDLYTVSKLVGDSIAMIEKTYGHLLPEHKRKAMELMADVFADPKNPAEIVQGVTQE